MAGGPTGPLRPAPQRRLSTLSGILLGLAVLASAGFVVVLGVVIFLFVSGYSGPNDPTSFGGLFPLAIGLFLLAGVPAGMLTAVLWAGFAFSLRRRP
ncbi:MAG TPA: hypothetical protein VGI58_16120 [Streptosporangiaceae bacterium]|jgi:hypothetical protein